MSAAVTHERWQVAQAAESEYWASLASSPEEFTRIVVEKSGVARWIDANVPPRAKEGSAVEVGIGPLGIGCVHFLVPQTQGELVGVEPIPLRELDEANAPTPLVAAVSACRAMRYRHVRAAGEETGLPDESFSLAVSYNVLDHVRDPYAVLSEMHRILVPGGLLVLGCDTVSLVTRARYNVYLTRRHAHEVGVRAHTFRFSAYRLERLLRGAGFRIRTIDERPFRPLRHLAGRSQRLLVVAERQS